MRLCSFDSAKILSLLSSNGLFFLLLLHLLHPNVLRDRDTFTSRNTHARLTLSNDNVRTRAFFWGFALLALLATLSAVFTSSSFDLASSAPGGEGRRRLFVRRCRRMQTNERLGKNWRFNRVLCRRFVFIPRDRDSLRRLLRRIIGGNIGGFGFVSTMSPGRRLWRQGLPRQNLRVH